MNVENPLLESMQSSTHTENHTFEGTAENAMDDINVAQDTMESSEARPVSGNLNMRQSHVSRSLSGQDKSTSLLRSAVPSMKAKVQCISHQAPLHHTRGCSTSACKASLPQTMETSVENNTDDHQTDQTPIPSSQYHTVLSQFVATRRELKHEMQVLNELEAILPPDPQSVLAYMLIAFSADVLCVHNMLHKAAAHTMPQPGTFSQSMSERTLERERPSRFRTGRSEKPRQRS